MCFFHLSSVKTGWTVSTLLEDMQLPPCDERKFPAKNNASVPRPAELEFASSDKSAHSNPLVELQSNAQVFAG